FMQRLREAVGLRRHVAVAPQAGQPEVKTRNKPARFVSFRDADGRFRFRLIAGDGTELLLSEPFADPKAAGVAIKAMQQPDALQTLGQAAAGRVVVSLDGKRVVEFDAALVPQVNAALASMAE